MSVPNNEIISLESLERFLGVPFFEKLGNIARQRLSTMDDATGHIYGTWIMEGVSNRYPLIEDDFRSWFMEEVCGERLSALAEPDGVEGVKFDGSVVFQDLLIALGENISITGASEISLEHLHLLDKVWTGQNMRIADLIDLLDQGKELEIEQYDE